MRGFRSAVNSPSAAVPVRERVVACCPHTFPIPTDDPNHAEHSPCHALCDRRIVNPANAIPTHEEMLELPRPRVARVDVPAKVRAPRDPHLLRADRNHRGDRGAWEGGSRGIDALPPASIPVQQSALPIRRTAHKPNCPDVLGTRPVEVKDLRPVRTETPQDRPPPSAPVRNKRSGGPNLSARRVDRAQRRQRRVRRTRVRWPHGTPATPVPAECERRAVVTILTDGPRGATRQRGHCMKTRVAGDQRRARPTPSIPSKRERACPAVVRRPFGANGPP